MTDPGGHGTGIASLVAGKSVGTNPLANIIPVKAIAAGAPSIGSVSRAVVGILEAHQSRGNPKAVINMSFVTPTSQLRGNNTFLQQQLDDKTDPVLTRFNNANIATVMSAGNNATNDLSAHTPQRWAGSDTNHIVVGAADQNGLRAEFSTFLDSGLKGYLSVYTIGVNVICADF
ncbi:peptidase S8/S53 domain-containing protein [Xylogone sp. PMI_703]|nr:peptidase S8/S53 domain-containing protein [Xylogone sp. PMI_703]